MPLLWFNQTVWKKGRGSILILPRSMRVKMRFQPEGNYSRLTGADRGPAITQLSRLAILWHPFYVLHPSAHSLDTNTFGSTKPFGKKDAGLSSSSPGQCVSKCFLNLKVTIPDPQVPTDGQLQPNAAILSHPFCNLDPSATPLIGIFRRTKKGSNYSRLILYPLWSLWFPD